MKRLNPFAVTIRCDELDIDLMAQENAVGLVMAIRDWAESQVGAAARTTIDRLIINSPYEGPARTGATSARPGFAGKPHNSTVGDRP